jgi:hypothetical protein
VLAVASLVHCNVLISNEVVAAPKIARMVALAAQGGGLPPCTAADVHLYGPLNVIALCSSATCSQSGTAYLAWWHRQHIAGIGHTDNMTGTSSDLQNTASLVQCVELISNEVVAAPKMAPMVALVAQGGQLAHNG